MNVVLWVVTGLLAAVNLMSGATKVAQPREKLAAGQMGWAADMSDVTVKLIGVAELLAAIGLVLPWALDIAPVLTPLAAVGFAVIMAGAIVVHVRRKENSVVAINGVLLALSLFVAIGRFANWS
jgi:hypothetical protein